MADYITVIKTINFNVIEQMTEGVESYLSADTILLEMAIPVTQLDPISIPSGKEKKLFSSIQSFKEKSRKRLESYTKDGIKQVLIKDWLPTLPEEYKQKLISEFGIVRGFDSDGYAIFDQKFFDTYTAIMNNQDPQKENRLVSYKKGTGSTAVSSTKSDATIGGKDYKVYYPTCTDGFWSADSHITEDQWYKIIQGASNKIKAMLHYYLQLPEPYIASCSQIEQKFGIKAGSINSCNTALGQRAQIMMGDISYQDAQEPHNERYWYYAMKGGYKDKETNTFVWQAREEVMKAAARVAAEEKW